MKEKSIATSVFIALVPSWLISYYYGHVSYDPNIYTSLEEARTYEDIVKTVNYGIWLISFIIKFTGSYLILKKKPSPRPNDKLS